jgi:hypothetical protein
MTSRKGIQQFNICHRKGHYALQSPTQHDFAVLDSHITKALGHLSNIKPIRFEALLSSDVNRQPRKQRRKGGDTLVITISVNIYGSRNLGQSIGKRLSATRTFLQHPFFLPAGMKYDNPHFYKLPNRTAAIPSSCIPVQGNAETRNDQIAQATGILDSLHHHTQLRQVHAGSSVVSELLQYVSNPLHVSLEAWLISKHQSSERRPPFHITEGDT